MKLIKVDKDDAEIDESYEEVRDKFLELGAHATEVLGHQFAQQLTPAFRVIGTTEWLTKEQTCTRHAAASAAAGGAPVPPFSRVFEPLFDAHMELLDALIPKDALKGKLAVIVQSDVVTEYFRYFAKSCVPLSVKNGGGAGYTERKTWPDADACAAGRRQVFEVILSRFSAHTKCGAGGGAEPLDSIAGLYEGYVCMCMHASACVVGWLIGTF